MSDRYEFKSIEARWQKHWERTQAFEVNVDSDRPKYYTLEMLPYPSGALHMGHVRNYSLGDSMARFMRMRGFNVLHPLGWDAFGLPAENAAIKHQIPPEKWTMGNIARMKQQSQRMGWAYDWSRELASCLPDYYRWNQWFFIQMWRKGLAYKKKAFVNWCNQCQTVLANEQVENGRCWRDESLVEQKELEQWYWRITNYAQELLDDLDTLESWPEKVLTMQRNWIGRSKGASVKFPIEGGGGEIEVFTTRLDTIFGATFAVLAPEHPLVSELAKESDQAEELAAFAAEMRHQTNAERIAEEGEKRGVFTGRYAINPFSKERIPIWVANFVLMDYGTGAIMAVPAHDQRDFEFATRYQIPIRTVIDSGELGADEERLAATSGYGTLVNSGEFNGLESDQAQTMLAKLAEEKGFGRGSITYRLKDWGISRQRYWGTPIPMIECPQCGTVPVPEEELPVLLPRLEGVPSGGSPLAGVKEFVETSCPACGEPARRETDTMDTFVDSSWYFYRYTDSRNSTLPFDPDVVKYWFPVDLYVGGVEHAVLHLIYMRFFTKVMRDLGLVELDEPVTTLFTQGMVIKDGAKMSKSLGNVVSPDEVIDDYGADALRLFIQFCAPPEGELEWNKNGLEGCFRFLKRFWRLVVHHRQRNPKLSVSEDRVRPGSDEGRALLRKLHQTIRKVTADLERVHQNTAIAAIMELLNSVSAAAGDPEEAETVQLVLEKMTLLSQPFVPHFAEEVWERLGQVSGSAGTAGWPQFDPELAREEEILVVVQVNGKVRSKFSAAPDISGKEMESRALEDEKIQAQMEGLKVKRIIVIPRRLVNIVAG